MQLRILTTLTLIAGILFFGLAMAHMNQSKSMPYKAYFNNLTADTKKQIECLAENIYFEAAHEPEQGKVAVAFVTLNRVKSKHFENDICGVVKQKDEVNGRMVCQFSWFCGQVYSMVRNPYQWEESVLVAKKALTSAVAHDTLYREKAMFYHANYVKPNWNLPRITQIGNHIFYKERNRI
jgi:spore germination cell wall hydrolase CwlJ-like protein